MIVEIQGRKIEIDDKLAARYKEEYLEPLDDAIINCYLIALYHNKKNVAGISTIKLKTDIENCIKMDLGEKPWKN